MSHLVVELHGLVQSRPILALFSVHILFILAFKFFLLMSMHVEICVLILLNEIMMKTLVT